jgi:hypothetical protein
MDRFRRLDKPGPVLEKFSLPEQDSSRSRPPSPGSSVTYALANPVNRAPGMHAETFRDGSPETAT